jgi:hypothetical protein
MTRDPLRAPEALVDLGVDRVRRRFSKVSRF